MSDTIRITTLTMIAFQLNGALDTGRYPNVPYDDMVARIENGTVFDHLEQLIPELDISLLSQEARTELISEWQDMVGVGRIAKKLLVEKNGLCLLVAFCLEGIQRRK